MFFLTKINYICNGLDVNASMPDILRKCFFATLSEIRTISYKARVGNEHSPPDLVYAVDGLHPICTPYQAGVEYDCFFLLYVRPERPTEVTKTAPHFCVCIVSPFWS